MSAQMRPHFFISQSGDWVLKIFNFPKKNLKMAKIQKNLGKKFCFERKNSALLHMKNSGQFFIVSDPLKTIFNDILVIFRYKKVEFVF